MSELEMATRPGNIQGDKTEGYGSWVSDRSLSFSELGPALSRREKELRNIMSKRTKGKPNV